MRVRGDNNAPMPALHLPFGRPRPTLRQQEPQIAALLAPLGRTGLSIDGRGRPPRNPVTEPPEAA